MIKLKYVLGVGVAALLASCGSAPREEEQIRPVKVVAAQSLGSVEKSFSGVVMPDQYSNLAFKVGGPLIALNVVEGEFVRKGQVVAEIDPIDYRLQYEARRSSFLTAKSQVERAERLLARDAISRQDYEVTRANYDNAKAAFENTESLLAETKLRAPFDGFVQEKFVENYQKVQAGTSIIRLIDPNQLQIRFIMPEGNLKYLLADPDIFVEFETQKGIRFKSRIKEYVPASADGAGVPVFLTITDERFNPKKLNLGVGFTCRAILRHKSPGKEGACLVPISSIFAIDGNKAPHLFVYNQEKGIVELRKVRERGLTGRCDMIVQEGVAPGELVVVAGSTRLVDGQKVRLMAE